MDLLDACRARAGCSRAGAPVVVLLSGGRDSVCLLDVACELGAAGVARCTSTTGCAPEADADEAHCRGAVRPARRGARRRARRRRPAAATCRRGRATSATRRAARLAPRRGADVAAGHTATDQAETSSTGWRRRRGAGRCSAWRRAPGGSCARCSTSRARRPRRAALRAGWPGARTRPTTIRASRATASARRSCPRCARSHPARRGEHRCAPRSCCATRPRCSTRSSATALDAAGDRIALEHLRGAAAGARAAGRAAPGRGRGAGRPCPRAAARAEDDPGAAPRTARSTSATACARSSSGGVLRFERHAADARATR